MTTSCRTGKWRYRDEIAARLTLAAIQRQDTSARPAAECRAYRCPLCGGWHLTSSPHRPRRPM